MKSLFEIEIENNEAESLKTLQKKEKLDFLLQSNLDFKNENHNDFRHSWHAFPAKFPPKLARLFIENLTDENDFVLDPMMGSCTTLLEADLLRRNCYGFDIDPLSLIIGKAKFQKLDFKEILSLSNKVISNAIKKVETTSNIDLELKKRFDPETLKFIDYWFPKNTIAELLALIQEIEKIDKETHKLFFMTIFSSIIITKSGGVTFALDLAHTRPHKSTEKKTKSVFIEFSKKIKKHLEYRYPLSSNIIIEKSDAKKLYLQDDIIDLIITSPPYANNAIDYMRAHKFSLVWFGMSINNLRNIRKDYIGSETLTYTNKLELPDFINEIIWNLKGKNKKKGMALHKYFSEMLMVIQEAYRVLKKDSAFILVVASSTLNGIDIKTHLCLGELGKLCGFELVRIGKRNLNRDRRMMPSRHNSNLTSIEARMHEEYVIGFWKNDI